MPLYNLMNGPNTAASDGLLESMFAGANAEGSRTSRGLKPNADVETASHLRCCGGR